MIYLLILIVDTMRNGSWLYKMKLQNLYLLLCLLTLFLAGCFTTDELALREEFQTVGDDFGIDVPGFSASELSGDDLNIMAYESIEVNDASLNAYLRVAALNSPALKSAYYKWQAALERAPQVRALPEPTISYTRYIEQVETRVGSQENAYTIMQKIPWPTKLLRKSDLEVRKAWILKHQYDFKKLEVFYNVRKAYFEYAYLRKSIQVVEDNLVLLKNIESGIRKQYEVDRASNPALIQSQLEIGRIENRLLTLKDLRPALMAQLNAAVGSNPLAELPWPETTGLVAPPLETMTLLNSLLEKNPSLQAARAQIKAKESKRKLAKTEYFPDFSIGGSIIDTDERTDMYVPENGKNPIMLTVGMSLPIWHNKYNAGVREAEAEIKSAEHEFKNKSNALSAELKMALFKYNDAGRKRSLFLDTLIPKAEQALEAARTAFSAGKVGFTDLLEAERSLLELSLMAERAIIDQQIWLAKLESLAGKSL